MDRRERFTDRVELLKSAMEGNQAEIWTALPGIIQNFNSEAVTATIQPAIKGILADERGKESAVSLPLLVDVPVIFPRGGGFTLTFPIKAGDECLVVFASRCIDDWWQSGGEGAQIDRRMHDLSDGFALVGPFSQKSKIKNIKTDCAEIRTDDGGTSAAIYNNKIVLTAELIEINGDVKLNGNLTATENVISNNSVNLGGHQHPCGNSSTGQPYR